MKLSFHRLVQPEANEAARWYEDQKEGLGDDFFLKLTQALNQISENPQRFGFWLESQSVRRAKLKRFPYAILYEIRPGKVRILCVRHNKRHPAFGRGRS